MEDKKILICDDAAFMRMMIRDILEKKLEIKKANIFEAIDGKDGIEKFKKTKPDLILMDITMPEMDGITALKEIIKIDSNANVIICSAMGQQGQVDEAIKLGAKDFIVKPFKADRIKEAIVKCLK